MDLKIFPDEQFFLSLREAGRTLVQTADRALSPLGITVTEYEMLRILQRHPGMTAADLRRRLRVSGPSMVESVARLRSKKLIEYAHDAADLRRRTLLLTAQALRTLRSARQAIGQLLQPLGLSDAGMIKIARQLQAITLRASSISPSPYA